MKKPYSITYYCGPSNEFYKNRCQEIVDCGFNLIQLERGDLQERKELLRYCEKHGIRCCVHDFRLIEFLHRDWQNSLNNIPKMEAVIKDICEIYRDFPAVYSYNIIDEPAAEKFPLLAKIVELFKKYDPKHFCYINLLPTYADPDVLGTPTYEEYLRQFMEIVKPEILSYDHYHFETDNRPDEDITITDEETARAYAAKLNRIDRNGFFDNLEIVRKVAQEYNVPYMLIVLLTEHGSFRYLLPEEIRFEVYQTLVYGCATVSYFRFWSSEERPYPYWRDQNSIVSDDILCQHYFDVQKINAEICGIGECIANTTSEAVFHVGDEADAVQFFTEYKGITDIRGGRYSVGFFADDSFLIANKDYLNPSLCTVETDAVLEIFDSKAGKFVPVCEKQFHIPAGGGVYLRKC